MEADKLIKQLEDRLEFAGWIGGGGDDDHNGCGGSAEIGIISPDGEN